MHASRGDGRQFTCAQPSLRLDVRTEDKVVLQAALAGQGRRLVMLGLRRCMHARLGLVLCRAGLRCAAALVTRQRRCCAAAPTGVGLLRDAVKAFEVRAANIIRRRLRKRVVRLHAFGSLAHARVSGAWWCLPRVPGQQGGCVDGGEASLP